MFSGPALFTNDRMKITLNWLRQYVDFTTVRFRIWRNG